MKKGLELERIMTFQEAARLWGLNESTLRKRAKDGGFKEGEVRKSGGTWLVTEEAMMKIYGGIVMKKNNVQLKVRHTTMTAETYDKEGKPKNKRLVRLEIFPQQKRGDHIDKDRLETIIEMLEEQGVEVYPVDISADGMSHVEYRLYHDDFVFVNDNWEEENLVVLDSITGEVYSGALVRDWQQG